MAVPKGSGVPVRSEETTNRSEETTNRREETTNRREETTNPESSEESTSGCSAKFTNGTGVATKKDPKGHTPKRAGKCAVDSPGNASPTPSRKNNSVTSKSDGNFLHDKLKWLQKDHWKYVILLQC